MSEIFGSKQLKSIYYHDNNGTKKEIIKRIQNGKIVFQKISDFVPLSYLEKTSDFDSGHVDLGYYFNGNETSIIIDFRFEQIFGISGCLVGAKDVNSGSTFKIGAYNYPNPIIKISFGLNTSDLSINATDFLIPGKDLRITLDLSGVYDTSFGWSKQVKGFVANAAGDWEQKLSFNIDSKETMILSKGSLYAFACHQINEYNTSTDIPTDYLKYGKIHKILIANKIKEPMVTSLVREYIPKKQTATNKIGLYETQLKQFHEVVGEDIIGK